MMFMNIYSGQVNVYMEIKGLKEKLQRFRLYKINRRNGRRNLI